MRVTRATRNHAVTVGRSAAAGLGVTLAATTFATSYALQRLASALVGEPAWTTIVYQEHVPYYWRVGVAALHALIVGVAVGLGVREERAAWLLQWTPLLVPLVTLPLALAMVAVP